MFPDEIQHYVLWTAPKHTAFEFGEGD